MHSERHDFIVDLIQKSGEILLGSRDRNIPTTFKDGDLRNLLTTVDLEVNDFIVKKIAEKYPEEEVYSEESARDVKSVNFWSIDPIDGTSNFARSIPHFAVVISFIEGGVPVVGAIYNPVTKELFSFEKGKGAFLNKKQIHVNKVAELREAYVLLHIGRKEEIRTWGIRLQEKLLAFAKKNSNLGSSALDLAFLAAGRVDAVVYGTMTTQDIAVALGLLREAGGEVYDLEGNPVELRDIPQQIIATSNKDLFGELLNV